MPGKRAANFLLGKVAIDGTVTTGPIPAGTNNIGDVDVASIAAGNNNIGDVDVASVAPPTAIAFGRITVTTAGTEVQGSAQALTQGVTVRALTANTGLMFIGGANTVASTTGYQLAAGESVFVACDNLSDLWVDSAVNGEGVSYIGG